MASEPINVAASIIADVSAGIYRTPAGALKELISNAFDADATSVRVTTGWPHFKTFTCTDDGSGMTEEEFRGVMGHIGGSDKRDRGQLSPKYNRPLIGRIGIGLFSIAQVCRQFTVISSKRGVSKKFKAAIDLEPFMLAEARRAHLGQKVSTEQGKVRIGTFEIEEAEEDSDKQYTRIIMEAIDPGFRQRLMDFPQKRAGFSPKRFTEGSIAEFLKIVERNTVSEHGAYAQLVWELAATSPVEYLPHGPAKAQGVLRALRERLSRYNFKAYLDGVELRKPIRLPRRADKSIENRLYPIEELTKSISPTRRLQVQGYLYWQKGRILPRELQGILVRVRNVAIGQYDPTYLGYPHHEGWKFSQLTGELYADDGLDQAVNIDRASFRESDEAFIELQSLLFEKLKGGTDEGAGVFSNIKSETTKIRKSDARRVARKQAQVLGSIVLGGKRKLEVQPVQQTRGPGIDLRRDTVEIEAELLSNVPHKFQQLFSSVCTVLEKQLMNSLESKKRRQLYERLALLFKSF